MENKKNLTSESYEEKSKSELPIERFLTLFLEHAIEEVNLMSKHPMKERSDA